MKGKLLCRTELALKFLRVSAGSESLILVLITWTQKLGIWWWNLPVMQSALSISKCYTGRTRWPWELQ